MKKRIYTLIVVFAMLIVMIAACANETPVQAPEPPEQNQEAATPEPTPEPEEDEQDSSPMRGEWDGYVYTNEYLGLRLALSDGWVIASEADIAEIMGLSEDIIHDITGNELPDDFWDLNETATFHDVMVSNIYNNSNIQIIFEKLAAPNHRISATEYIEATAPLLEGMGFEVDTSKSGTGSRIGDESWYMLATELSYMGTELSQRMFVNVHKGIARIITITFSEENETLDDILGMFLGMNDPIPETASTTLEIDSSLVGTWAWDLDDDYIYIFNNDGTLTRGYGDFLEEYEWGVEGSDHLLIGSGPFTESWTFSIEDNVLTLESRQETSLVFSYNFIDD